MSATRPPELTGEGVPVGPLVTVIVCGCDETAWTRELATILPPSPSLTATVIRHACSAPVWFLGAVHTGARTAALGENVPASGRPAQADVHVYVSTWPVRVFRRVTPSTAVPLEATGVCDVRAGVTINSSCVAGSISCVNPLVAVSPWPSLTVTSTAQACIAPVAFFGAVQDGFWTVASAKLPHVDVQA